MLKVSEELIARVRLAVADWHFGPMMPVSKSVRRVRRAIEIGYRLALNVQQNNALTWAPPYEPDEYRTFSSVSEISQSEPFGEMSAIDVGFLDAYGDWFRVFVLLNHNGAILAVDDDFRRVSKKAGEFCAAEREKMRHRNEFGPTVAKFRELSGMPDKAKVPLGIVVDWADERDDTTDEEREKLHEARDLNADL